MEDQQNNSAYNENDIFNQNSSSDALPNQHIIEAASGESANSGGNENGNDLSEGLINNSGTSGSAPDKSEDMRDSPGLM